MHSIGRPPWIPSFLFCRGSIVAGGNVDTEHCDNRMATVMKSRITCVCVVVVQISNKFVSEQLFVKQSFICSQCFVELFSFVELLPMATLRLHLFPPNIVYDFDQKIRYFLSVSIPKWCSTEMKCFLGLSDSQNMSLCVCNWSDRTACGLVDTKN